MSLKSFSLIFYWVVLFNCVDSFNILQITALPSKSHYFLSRALANGLAEAGHNVTFITTFETEKLNEDKFELVVLHNFFKSLQIELPDFVALGKKNAFTRLRFTCYIGNLITRKTFEHPTFQKILNSNEKYDAVIIEQYYSDALKVLAHKFNAPLILFHGVGATSAVNSLVGNPSPRSYISDISLRFGSKITFWQKIENLIVSIFTTFYRYFIFFPQQNRIMKEFYPEAPDLDILNYNASLILLMSHKTTQQAVPLVPNMINVGGIHLKPPKGLDDMKHLKQFLDSAEEGIVYFGMGTNLKLSSEKKEIQNILFKNLGKLKQKVIMQWDEENPKNVPGNILLSKWFPQQSILAHPNTKLFITHGGLLSLSETVYHGVPILGLPVFADQYINTMFAEESEFGLRLPLHDITEEDFSAALEELLNNPKYLENARKQSALSRDRPMSPLQTAVYWVEFVCRHKGAKHLRVAGTDLFWFQYYLVDVIIFLLFIITMPLVVLYTICRKLLSHKRVNTNEIQEKNKKNEKKIKIKET